jgi:hypothetical protein
VGTPLGHIFNSQKAKGGASRFYEGASGPTSKGIPHGSHASYMQAYTRANRHSPTPALPLLLDEDMTRGVATAKFLILVWGDLPHGQIVQSLNFIPVFVDSF